MTNLHLALKQSLWCAILLTSASVAYAQVPDELVSPEGLFESSAFNADVSDSSNDLDIDRGRNPYDQCAQWGSTPWECNRIPGCQFSRIFNQCVSSGVGPVQPYPPQPYPNPHPYPPHTDICSQQVYYSECMRLGCQYDHNNGLCYGGFNPDPYPSYPGPGPEPTPPFNYCSAYNSQQTTCERSGCYYDWTTGLCSDFGND